MNKFYESDFNYKEVYNKFNSIISKLESKNCKFALDNEHPKILNCQSFILR